MASSCLAPPPSPDTMASRATGSGLTDSESGDCWRIKANFVAGKCLARGEKHKGAEDAGTNVSHERPVPASRASNDPIHSPPRSVQRLCQRPRELGQIRSPRNTLETVDCAPMQQPAGEFIPILRLRIYSGRQPRRMLSRPHSLHHKLMHLKLKVEFQESISP